MSCNALALGPTKPRSGFELVWTRPDASYTGPIAQLGERLGTPEVAGSSPASSMSICRGFSRAAERPPSSCNPYATRAFTGKVGKARKRRLFARIRRALRRVEGRGSSGSAEPLRGGLELVGGCVDEADRAAWCLEQLDAVGVLLREALDDRTLGPGWEAVDLAAQSHAVVERERDSRRRIAPSLGRRDRRTGRPYRLSRAASTRARAGRAQSRPRLLSGRPRRLSPARA